MSAARAYGDAVAALLDNVRFVLPYIGLLAGGVAIVGAAIYVATLAIERIANRGGHG